MRERRYCECEHCGLVYLSPPQRPDRAAEHRYYLTHRNDPADARYRAFLSRLSVPLLERLTPGMRGLDYGCGPGPTLSIMLEAQGMRMATYDPLFAPDPQALGCTYDFITCSEVIEHFHDPAAEFARLDRMLRPGGWLGVMTGILVAGTRFAEWHYIRDPTHVSFYRPRTLEWIAAAYGWRLELALPHVALFEKPSA